MPCVRKILLVIFIVIASYIYADEPTHESFNHCSARSRVQDSIVRILLGVESLQVCLAVDVESLQILCVCVCVCLHVHVCVCVCVCASILCMCVCVCAHCVCMCVCVHACICVCVCVCVCVSVCVYVCVQREECTADMSPCINV